MDSMTEMFYDESNGIVHDLRQSLQEDTFQKEVLQGGRADAQCDQTMVQEIFRGVHTLKADSTMMLYENVAEVSKELEGLLYCFRGEGKVIGDKERFQKLVYRYLDFVEEETDKLSEGKMLDGKDENLLEEIQKYIAEQKAQMEEHEIASYHTALSGKTRQVYYISSAPQENTSQQEKEKTEETMVVQPANKSLESGENRKTYMISQEEREKICRSVFHLQRVVDKVEGTFTQDQGKITKEQLENLQSVLGKLMEVKSHLVNTDFVPVAKKMEILVDEMSAKLGKPTKLLVKGEDTIVDPQKREKISVALIHIIRNAMDHGIEDMDTRDRYGKSPMALIRLKFKTEDGHLKVSVKDDGAGMDKEKIIKKAEKLGVLTKPASEYTEKEIWNLVLVNGLTTTEEANEYSGRGVGMDAIYYNVKQLGGKLKISSVPGEGTTITMKF